jgi:DNA-binding Lrp family transcriptional regulator
MRSSADFALLNDYQRRFPLVPAPYQVLAAELDDEESRVIDRLRQLSESGAISRVGAVFRPGAIGAGALAAMAVPAARIEEVAGMVSAHAEVNHNYLREHRYNLWFVATAPDRGRLAQLIASLAGETGIPVLTLPLIEEYHIDLGFDLDSGHRQAQGSRQRPEPFELDAGGGRLIAALERGLPLVSRPFRELARQARLGEDEVIARIAAWQQSGVIRRFGVIVRHKELGYSANAMAVWDVPDEQCAQLGERLAGEQGVNLCYRRERALPAWRYNLYCMVHGRDRARVEASIRELAARSGAGAYPGAVLFSQRRFKQTGARYAPAASSMLAA